MALLFTGGCGKNRRPEPEGGQPLIIAHRGGKMDYPENTLLAFKKALDAGVDGIELDVQLTSDNVPVLYHPGKLEVWTNGTGEVRKYSLQELQQLNAAYNYYDKGTASYAYRNESNPPRIPTLEEALAMIPGNKPVIIDFKSNDTATLVNAVLKVVAQRNDWERVVFYSTNDKHLRLITDNRATVFESRDSTRKRLLRYRLSDECWQPAGWPYKWLGFELKRTINVSESLQLGNASTTVEMVDLWNKEVVQCIRKNDPHYPKVVLFGINNREDWQEAVKLKVDAVYTDAPAALMEIAGRENRQQEQ